MNISKIYFESYKGNDPYIFISYAHKDSEIVYPIIKDLHDMGYNIWYDEGIDPGNEWAEEIGNALVKCNYFIVFISNNSANSKNVKDEINMAIDETKSFLAIHIEETKLPVGLRLRIGSNQAIMYYRMEKDSFKRKIITVLSKINWVNTNSVSNRTSAKTVRDEEEEIAWKKAISENTIEAYKDYLGGNTIKKYKAEAEQKIITIQNLIEVERMVWEMASRENTIEAYSNYLNSDYLKIFKKEALNNIEILREKEEAINELKKGEMYYFGIGVKKDYSSAFKYYKISAEKGNIEAQYRIGSMYEDGYFVEKDYSKALEWYFKAAERGKCIKPQVERICEKWIPGEKKAFELWLKVAEQGDVVAQVEVGYRYYNGIGVRKSRKKAIKWYTKASENGNVYASDELMVIKNMSWF